jgi:hypothetical protein
MRGALTRAALLITTICALSADAASRFTLVATVCVPDVREMSGIAVVRRIAGTGGACDTAVCLAVSDKAPNLYQMRLPVPSVPASGELRADASVFAVIGRAVDLEDVAIDKKHDRVWIAAEHEMRKPGRVYCLSLTNGEELGRFAIDSIINEKGNGAECIAFVPGSARTPDELWVGKERFIPPGRSPPIFRFRIEEDSLRLKPTDSFRLDMPLHRTQSGFAWDALHKRVWVISREIGMLFSVAVPAARSKTVAPDSLSFSYDWDHLLHNATKFGIAEGIAYDELGWLYVAFDNNDDLVGLDSTALSRDSRVMVLRPRR